MHSPSQIYSPLSDSFFDNDAVLVAKQLIGKMICVKHEAIWLTVQIIETEAYYLTEKASHSSLGYTFKRRALFMPPGTIYMYYARGGDSLNISCGQGNAVLIKSGIPYVDEKTHPEMLAILKKNNPHASGGDRIPLKLCSGQTLLCKALGLKVPEWNAKIFDLDRFYIADRGIEATIIPTTRLGIPKGRDEHLPYRFIDVAYMKYCTRPLGKKNP